MDRDHRNHQCHQVHQDPFPIDFPDDSTIEAQIKSIVTKGLAPKESFYSYLKNMYGQLGFKYMFRDITEIIFALVLGFLILLFVAIGTHYSLAFRIDAMYSFIFIFSPVLYLITSIIFFIQKKNRVNYEVEMTCKYNIYQLAAFRMLVFSLICMALNAILIYFIMASFHQINFLYALMLSAASLFLFSTAFLYTIIRMSSSIAKYGLTIGWMLLNLLLFTFNTEQYTLFLSSLPIYVYVVIAAVCFFFYIKHLKKLITFRSTGGVV
ncbi:hypothetical protein [Paenibacillus eucommiae]|uniref:Membrane-associated HD superfamily phosphohydrolase n=1 Tax=Paenibacillus eucommiae TaxID=1355755 RepID=A0ABS4J1C8_9BACL|nr:hypothetical protein [Paenibacillus eucommiae]MBP1993635.1 membrane-associated HD superfamily phosphohydrolase [Paenibacillus eucommiae]